MSNKNQNNEQWNIESESLEKMSFRSKEGIRPGNYMFEYLTHNEPHEHEQLHSTTPVTSKHGEQLYHHIFVDKKVDHTKDSDYDVHHVLSRHEDPRKPGVAAALTGQHSNVNVNTAEGKKHVKEGGVLYGIRVAGDENKGKGYGPHLFHNLIHHHGSLIGDVEYSPEGIALSDKAAKHPKIHFVNDTAQSHEDAKHPTKGTRRIHSLKDQSQAGKIPPTM